MDERFAHMGPLPLPEGVVFSQELSDRVLLETGVRASYRHRPHWGTGKLMTLAGPIDNLQEALTRIILYGTAVGGGGGGEGGGPVGGGGGEQ